MPFMDFVNYHLRCSIGSWLIDFAWWALSYFAETFADTQASMREMQKAGMREMQENLAEARKRGAEAGPQARLYMRYFGVPLRTKRKGRKLARRVLQ